MLSILFLFMNINSDEKYPIIHANSRQATNHIIKQNDSFRIIPVITIPEKRDNKIIVTIKNKISFIRDFQAESVTFAVYAIFFGIDLLPDDRGLFVDKDFALSDKILSRSA